MYLHAVVVGAFPVEMAAVVVDAAVVQRAEAHEAVLQRVVPLLVHVVVPDHILFTGKPLQRGGGGVVEQQVGVYLNQTQNQQQVTLSLWKQQLRHTGANWQLKTPSERSGATLKDVVNVHLLCITHRRVPLHVQRRALRGFFEKPSRSLRMERQVCCPRSLPVSTFVLSPTETHFFN